MLYATISLQSYELQGHIDNSLLTERLNAKYEQVENIQADGDELERCCEILGRELPPNRVYTFVGDNAKEIAINWYWLMIFSRTVKNVRESGGLKLFVVVTYYFLFIPIYTNKIQVQWATTIITQFGLSNTGM